MRWWRRRAQPLGALLDAALTWTVDKHDDRQVELVFDYVAEPVAHEPVPDEPGSRPTFSVDVWMVAPPNIELNGDTYPKTTFFRDVVRRLRFHTPEVAEFARGQIPALDHYLELGLDVGAKRRLRGRVVQRVKLFANFINLRLKRLFDEAEVGDLDVADLIEIVRLAKGFRRRYVPALRATPGIIDDEVRQAVLLVDEYLSRRLERLGSSALLSEHEQGLEALALRRVLSDAASVLEASDVDLELEQMHYRHSLLKKFVSEPLYLHERRVQRDALYRNLVAATGAAFAATFSEMSRYQTEMAVGTRDFGLQLFVFIGLAVAAYVFKDRIKDLSKEYFNKKVKQRMADRDAVVYLDAFTSRGAAAKHTVGRLRDSVSYGDTESLPPEVQYHRARMAWGEAELPRSDVLHYTRSLVLRPDASAALGVPTTSLKDVIRISVNGFLRHLDNPSKDIAVFDSEEGCMMLSAPRVYYLDLHLRMTTAWGKASARHHRVRYEAVRVVLDKTGIVRIERPLPAERYGYEEICA